MACIPMAAYGSRMRQRRLAAAGCAVVAALLLLATPAVAAPRLDARFGVGGVARVPFPARGFVEFAGALRPVRQADGKVLVGAQRSGDRNYKDFVLARFGRTGKLDRSFGRRGRVRIEVPWRFRPSTVLALRDGRIVLVGTAGGPAYFASRPSQLAILRLLPDGSRDRSFGTSGFVVWNPPWRAANEWMDVIPGLALPQSDGRLLVAAHVDEGAFPFAETWQRVVLARFQPNGAVDQSFGRAGHEELDWDGSYFRGWARLADGGLAGVVTRHEGTDQPALETTAWWLHTFAANGPPPGLRSTSSLRLGLNVLDELVELAPTGDGSLVMIGDVDIDHESGPVSAVRRILPDGSLDATFGRNCPQPPLRARSRGGAPTRGGGALVTSTGLLIHARPRRVDGFVAAHDAAGCIAGRRLRLHGLDVGPPLLQGRRSAFVGATYGRDGLALIKIRR